MIIARKRKQVVKQIKRNILRQKYNAKAELNDPILSEEEKNRIVNKFWQNKQKLNHHVLNLIINSLFNVITPLLTIHDEVAEENSIKNLPSAFVTFNHYNQLDVLPIKKLAMKHHKRLYFMVEDTNLKMHFPINLIIRNADSIPITNGLNYLGRSLPQHLKTIFDKQNWVLVYPEQELWFNYRKPRPLQRGAYYYAAKLNIPIISCFAEIRERSQSEWFHRDFYKTKIILHILPTIYPDPNLSVNENANRMCKIDYQQKVAAYEKVYHQKLNYDFSSQDIAGLKK